MVRFKISLSSSSSEETPPPKTVNLAELRRFEEITRITGTEHGRDQEQSPRSHLQRYSRPVILERRDLPLSLPSDVNENGVTCDVTRDRLNNEKEIEQNHDTGIENAPLNYNVGFPETDEEFNFDGEELDDDHTLALVFSPPELQKTRMTKTRSTRTLSMGAFLRVFIWKAFPEFQSVATQLPMTLLSLAMRKRTTKTSPKKQISTSHLPMLRRKSIPRQGML
ncbi:hypothetical protein KC19_VG321700 [Ceratodon purpureus]|uniref:Uncharacterized protein n=1 Tax=Ceratodon purpureus TaxID=3225 RepID=A0A8T0HWB6_CERPU|nr:hypothetical protein KC19_VG321700 [Ceratodon purpureus]